MMHLQSEGITNFNAILTSNNTVLRATQFNDPLQSLFFLSSYHFPKKSERFSASGTHSFARTPVVLGAGI